MIPPALSKREWEVLQAYVDCGGSDKKAGALLRISYHTIKTHMASVRQKTGAPSIRMFVFEALRHGWLD
jgi:DNA-binding NarL/FixJ family response regulator